VHLRTGLSLRLGHRSPGLRIRPAGGRGTRKLQDVFVDARVPREERDAWPLVFAGDRLAWVPGVAVEADFSPAPGEPADHVSIEPMPVSRATKVVRLESPTSRGDLY
jgi:tRNA(Ile)-lysidine synthetase-like protein